MRTCLFQPLNFVLGNSGNDNLVCENINDDVIFQILNVSSFKFISVVFSFRKS